MNPPVPGQPVELLLARCRHELLAGLARAPEAALVVRYFARGKMLRARLVFLSAAACGGDPAEAMPGAIAIELLHGASLIHDDIIDGSLERRGLPALHGELGVGAALAIGDYVILHAISELARAGGLADDRRARAIGVIAHWGKECCRGEICELGTPGPSAYEQVARRKTGSLFAAAATLGAVLAEGAQPHIDALAACGLAIGVAYQIGDDLCDEPSARPASGPHAPGEALQAHLQDAHNELSRLSPSEHVDALAGLIRQIALQPTR